jgi:vacuolar-type H+-ATPase subunit H
MNRTFRECMNASASCAGRVLLDAARTLRKALREKRRRALTLAGNEIREKVSGAAKTVGQAVERTGERLQGAAKETEAAISSVSEHAKNLPGEILGSAKRTAEKASTITSQVVSTVGHSLTEAAGAVGDASQKLWQRRKEMPSRGDSNLQPKKNSSKVE